MFRKIVSNLPFSPALVGQLSFYAKRLRKEEVTRRIGLIFTVFAIAIQSLAVFVPPEASNASTPGQVGSAPRCTVSSVGPRGSAFTVDENKMATVSFDITGGKNCKVQLSANSFYAPSMDGRPYNKQVLYQRITKIYDTPGRYTMSVALPPNSTEAKGCYYQVDLTYGTHNVLPVIAYGHGTLDCKAPVTSATCSSLNVTAQSDTRFTLTGTAAVTNATISKYSFVITLPNGQTVEKPVVTNATTASVVYENSTPGTYKAVLTVTTSLGTRSGADCTKSFVVQPPTPVASCSAVSVVVNNRTQAYFTGTAQASGGAKITSYTFIVKDTAGRVVKRVVVPSTSNRAATSAVELTKDGKYSVQLVVQTSLGDKTNTTSCVTNFAISPPNVCQYNPLLPPSHPDCQPCPGNDEIWIKDEKCHPDVVLTKTGLNLTQGKTDATKVTANASDKITFTLTAENKGTAPAKATIAEDLSDVLEYAEIIDNGGGQFDRNTKTLTWPTVSLAPKEKTTRVIAVQMRNPIPTTNAGVTQQQSFDCKMVNSFGNTLTVAVSCPVEKQVAEQLVKELPHTGPRENMIFAGSLLAIVVYFWARSRQLGQEVRLIRRDVHAGAI